VLIGTLGKAFGSAGGFVADGRGLGSLGWDVLPASTPILPAVLEGECAAAPVAARLLAARLVVQPVGSPYVATASSRLARDRLRRARAGRRRPRAGGVRGVR
jgi:7-keto-8-aminopelargonate synthetase-like enzyme